MALLPSGLIGDEVRLQQIVVNLTTYAFKSNSSNESRQLIRLHVAYDEMSEILCIRLVQSNYHLPKEQLIKLQNFFNRRRKPKSGTGSSGGGKDSANLLMAPNVSSSDEDSGDEGDGF